MPRTPLLTRPAFLGIALASLALAACKKVPTAPLVVGGFTVVQGNIQVAQAGALLPAPVVLRVLDPAGAAIPNVTVVFAVIAGGGTVTPASVTSDANGEVSVKWTLGQAAAVQSLTASVGEEATLAIFANALFPASIVVAQGNYQTGKAGQALPNSVVIRVTGDNNVPLSSIPVQFQVVGGGGAISPQTVLTNAFGEATVKWTLGTTAGANSATASASTLSPAQLSATGTP